MIVGHAQNAPQCIAGHGLRDAFLRRALLNTQQHVAYMDSLVLVAMKNLSRAIGTQHDWSYCAAGPSRDLLQIKAQQRLAGLNQIACGDQRFKYLALEPDSIDSHMHHYRQPRSGADGYCVTGAWRQNNFTRARRMQDAAGGIDADTIAGQPPGEDWIRDLGEWYSPAIKWGQEGKRCHGINAYLAMPKVAGAAAESSRSPPRDPRTVA